jgi:hypothetical protein
MTSILYLFEKFCLVGKERIKNEKKRRLKFKICTRMNADSQSEWVIRPVAYSERSNF